MKVYQLLTLVSASVLVSACNNGTTAADKYPAVVTVKTTQVGTASTGSAARYSGTAEEENGTLLSFATAGTVNKVYIKEGAHVGQGQLIATLDPTQARNMYAATKATLAQAEDAYRRMKELHDKGSLPDIKLVDAQTALEQAQSAEKVAAKSLADCRLYAPFAGVIASKMVERGQNVTPGSPVAKLVTVGRLKVKISVPENEISQVAVGQHASVSVAALGGATLSGTVTEKGITADPMSRAYDVKITVANDGRRLMPGMVAEVTLEGKSEATACVIPANVVQLDENNNSFVWLAVNGKAVKRVITCGEFTAYGVTVVSGLTDGDRIITAGQQKVSSGTAVKETK